MILLLDLGVNGHNERQLLNHFVAHEPLKTNGFTYTGQQIWLILEPSCKL